MLLSNRDALFILKCEQGVFTRSKRMYSDSVRKGEIIIERQPAALKIGPSLE